MLTLKRLLLLVWAMYSLVSPPVTEVYTEVEWRWKCPLILLRLTRKHIETMKNDLFEYKYELSPFYSLSDKITDSLSKLVLGITWEAYFPP